jgi:hypothetical protein
MKPYLGSLYLDDEEWFIAKVKYHDDMTGGHGDWVQLLLRKHKSKEKKVIMIRSNDVLWYIVKRLQRQYPNASYWYNTPAKRLKLRRTMPLTKEEEKWGFD